MDSLVMQQFAAHLNCRRVNQGGNMQHLAPKAARPGASSQIKRQIEIAWQGRRVMASIKKKKSPNRAR